MESLEPKECLPGAAADPDRDAPSRSEHERVSRGMPGAVLADIFASAKGAEDEPESRDYGKRYEVRSILGEGGQGKVLAVYDRVLDREVALKALKMPISVQREKHLAREARITGILEHPNIPPTYDLGMDETGAPFFVMRKVHGVSLDQIVRDNRNARKEGLSHAGEYSRLRLIHIFVQVCNAISYAHSRGILHLDIKPQNVKLGSYGEVFVLDWGFAAKVEESPAYYGGTPLYIAPERLRREKADERADIFSLGVMLYRILTFSRPKDIPKMPFAEFRREYEKYPVIPPRERDATVSRELEAIVMKAMAEKAEERYQTVRELEDDLQRYLDGLPVMALPEHVFSRMWKFCRRHTVMVVMSTFLTLALVVGGILEWRYLTLEHRQRVEADLLARARIPFDRAQEYPRESERHLRQARGLFSQAIAVMPTFAEAYFERGKINMLLHDRDEAITDFAEALRLKPSYIMAHYYAGRIYMDASKDRDADPKFRNEALAAAEREFEQMRRIDPDDEYSNMGLAWIHERHGRAKEALDLCDRVEARSPAMNEVYLIRGLVYGNRDGALYDAHKALDAYTQYLSRTQENTASVYTNRGGIYHTLKDFDKALADYNKALEMNPEYFYALNDRGWIYYSQKHDYRAALADFNRAAEVNPQYYWTYVNIATVHEALGEWDKAESNYNWAFDLKPDDWRISARLGMVNLRTHRAEQAAACFDKADALSAGKSRGAVAYQRGAANFCLGRWDAARADFEKAVREDYAKPAYPALLWLAASARAGLTVDPAVVEPLFEATAAEKPWLSPILACWKKTGAPEAAIAAAQNPEALCETAFHLGLWSLGTGKPAAKAEGYFKQCRQTRVILYLEHAMADYELDRMAPSGNKESTAPVTRTVPDAGKASPETARPPSGVVIYE